MPLASRNTAQSRGTSHKKSGHWREYCQCTHESGLGPWAHVCDKCKKSVTESAEVNGVLCQLVSPTRIYVTATFNGKSICCLLDSDCERSVIASTMVPLSLHSFGS